MQKIQMNWSQKQKRFAQFFCAFVKSKSNFEHFQKQATFITYEFPKWQNPKNVVR